MFPIKIFHLITVLITSWCLANPPVDGALVPVIIVCILGFFVACYYAIERCRYAEAMFMSSLEMKPWGTSFDLAYYRDHLYATLLVSLITFIIFILALFIPGQTLRILTFGAGVFSAIFCLYMFVVNYEYVIESANS